MMKFETAEQYLAKAI